MTREEMEEWFKQVKGKPIRWTSWSNSSYFIPESLILNGGYIEGVTFGNNEIYKRVYLVNNGFNKFGGYKWEYYKQGSYYFYSQLKDLK